MGEPAYRSAKEVAHELGVSIRTVRRWIAQGRVESVRVGRILRIPQASYARLLARDGASVGRPRRGVSERGASYGAMDVLRTAAGGATTSAPTRAASGGARAAAMDRDSASRRLRRERSAAAAQMDRLIGRGRPPRNEHETADSILDSVRGELEDRLLGARGR